MKKVKRRNIMELSSDEEKKRDVKEEKGNKRVRAVANFSEN